MISQRTLVDGRLAIIALFLAACLAGCGSGSDGEFQEYGALESPEAPGSADAAAGNGENQPAESQNNSATAEPMLALSQPPVVAPVPQSIEATPDITAIDEGTLTSVAAPVPGIGANSNPSGSSDAANTTPATSPREVKILIKDRTFQAEGPEDAIRVSFDDIDLLKVINMEPVTADAPEKMPQWLKQLDGKRIRIRGYMYPAFKDTGLTAFNIARDTKTCCFGSFAKLYDRFLVKMRKGVTTDYFLLRPFDVVGILHIDPRAFEDGELYQMYRIDDAIIIKK
ncbi:MAG: hypothetical protein HON53_17565 [Planctomycetaceae bacterium]|jgi:hypothetical protein|nr:hypothetical protein [Planctomycetaceae bacterium]MBT6154304.1 hypothetical protein [Planctomycetaceae bacterium]MBT6485604.1 hypothetical protein [Planctomycetaceae bacterium]MBT6493587.1 hypothetical protein [Planctomycetaceae bacterium]